MDYEEDLISIYNKEGDNEFGEESMAEKTARKFLGKLIGIKMDKIKKQVNKFMKRIIPRGSILKLYFFIFSYWIIG